MWAIGEVAICAGSESGHLIGQALGPNLRIAIDKICGLLSSQKLDKSLAINLAGALGRFAFHWPQHLLNEEKGNQNIKSIFKQWILSLRMVKEEPEREQAFV